MLTGACHCGKTGWTFKGVPESATSCNCTLCRRYGTLWIYDYEGEGIALSGKSAAYTRADMRDPDLEIRFCESCGCVICWRGLKTSPDGRRRIAVNLRLTEPDPVARIPVHHFDGLNTFHGLPRDGRCVSDMWF